MAYWYTYPTSPSSSSDSEEDNTRIPTADQVQESIDIEREFFEYVGNHCQFYAFHDNDYLAWQMDLNPSQTIYLDNGMKHLDEIMDASTLEMIRKGIPQYKDVSIQEIICGPMHLEKDALVFIFGMAKDWIEYKRLDRSVTSGEYLNYVLWVVAKLVSFQMKHM